MQKPAFYGIVGVSIVVTAVSLGYSASRFLSVRHFAPRPAAVARGAAGPDSSAPQTPPERLSNVFAPEQGMEIPSRMTGIPRPAEAPTARYVLLGTIASESSFARRAILWSDGMKHPRIAREQEEIEPGVRLARIEREYVILARGGEQEKMEILPVGSKIRASAAPAPPAAGTSRAAEAPAAGEIHATRLGENSYSLDESTVTQLTTNINQFMTNVRIIPYFEGNRSAGYRIAAIRPGSAFEQLGFKGGDVIQQVNDVELSNPEKMYTIFQNLKDEKRVTVNILRQGQKNSITYEIR
ncbi:MAG: PDZ domain-containing protein [Deltaproteobacteria bacterium]|nr:PDZ domain-containing protein [Deltaproteobacteria bacterium]